jgi:gamma-glutamylputrescine oxidase
MAEGFNAGLGMAGSYYAATAAPQPALPPLTERIEADLVVVGGGCTGLSAALHAAERGLKVVLLEGGRIGWGASGRSGGQIIPGLRKGAAELIKLHGRERARALFDLSLEARGLVLERIARHDIACDLRLSGHLTAAVKRSDAEHLRAEADCLSTEMNYPHAAYLDAAAAREVVDTAYEGGLFDRQGGHLHGLNYALGLARAAREAGVAMFEGSVARALGADRSAPVVTTAFGAVKARHAILAGDALLKGIEPATEARIMPVASYVVATAPLAEARGLIPGDAAISDTRFVVNYYRTTADGRLLFGGGERYSPHAPADIAGFVRPHLERTFPSLRGVAIDHAWGGLVSVTTSRLPHLARQGEVYVAHGYSGMGVILSTLAGKLLADAIAGETAGFDRFAAIAPAPFPGGDALRGVLHVLGMLWYATRDRL